MTNSLDFKMVRECAFGIIDAVMVEHLPQGLCIEPLVPKRLMQSAHWMPALIDLRRMSVSKRNSLFDKLENWCLRGEPPFVTLFVKSDSSVTEIARHWNALQIAEPKRGQKFWLRLHDPRVLHQMLRVLNPLQRRHLFGVLQEFLYWVEGAWVTAVCVPGREPSNCDHRSAGSVSYAGPARWNWSRIERINLVNRALLGAGVKGADALTSYGALAEQLIERAVVRHALFELIDLVEFATRGLQTNPAFDNHPDVARAIRPRGVTDDSSLADRFALIEEQTWRSLRQSLNFSGDGQDDLGN